MCNIYVHVACVYVCAYMYICRCMYKIILQSCCEESKKEGEKERKRERKKKRTRERENETATHALPMLAVGLILY